MKIIILISLFFMSGCAAKFSCIDNPDAPGCHSVSAMYDVINKQKVHADSEHPEGYPEIIHAGTPIRGQSKLLRVWVAPWVDNDDDYHDQSYLYIVLNQGHWFIDQEVKKIESQYAPRFIPPVIATQKINNQNEAVTSTPTQNNTVYLK